MHRFISQTRLKLVLAVAWILLVFAGLGVEFWKHVLDGERTDLVYFLGLSYEGNLPTWYSSTLLLLCSLHLALIATAKSEQKALFAKHWWVLAAGFLYMSMDETAQVHENAGQWFDFGGVLFFGWVIPASIAVLLVGVSYLKFLAQLPGRPRMQFILAGVIYVGGALGVEFMLGYWVDRAGTKNLTYGLIDLVQESMEILGASLFLCSLVEYLGREAKTENSSAARISVGESRPRHALRASSDVECSDVNAANGNQSNSAELCEV